MWKDTSESCNLFLTMYNISLLFTKQLFEFLTLTALVSEDHEWRALG